MDSLELLREHRPTDIEPTPEALTASRAALMNRISAQKQGTTAADRRRGTRTSRAGRPGRRWGLLAGAAAVAAGALVVTQVLAPANSSLAPDAATAATLNTAADNALRFSDPVVKPGQYLRVDTQALNSAEMSYTANGAEEKLVSILRSTRETQYIPADRSHEWVWVRQNLGFQRFLPGTSAADQAGYKASPEWEADNNRPTERVTGLGGNYYAEAGGMGLERDFSGLPQEPRALLKHIYSAIGDSGPNRETEAFVWMADRLRMGSVDAKTRALFFRTMALIPGFKQLPGRVTQDGVSAVAVQSPPAEGQGVWQLLLDPDTGQFIGERNYIGTDTSPEYLTRSDVTTTSVVDSAPSAKDVEDMNSSAQG